MIEGTANVRLRWTERGRALRIQDCALWNTNRKTVTPRLANK
jgi:hypothetical protein